MELAPNFAIARFQLGLFQLTSGEANAALATLGPLDRLSEAHYLRAFVDGLRCLIRDDYHILTSRYRQQTLIGNFAHPSAVFGPAKAELSNRRRPEAMTRITNVDQALLLLRSHLQRAARSHRLSNHTVTSADRRSVLLRVREMASDAQTPEEALQRALIVGLILEELGGAEDDSRFQETVTKVRHVILADAAGRTALDRTLSQLIGAKRE